MPGVPTELGFPICCIKRRVLITVLQYVYTRLIFQLCGRPGPTSCPRKHRSSSSTPQHVLRAQASAGVPRLGGVEGGMGALQLGPEPEETACAPRHVAAARKPQLCQELEEEEQGSAVPAAEMPGARLSALPYWPCTHHALTMSGPSHEIANF